MTIKQIKTTVMFISLVLLIGVSDNLGAMQIVEQKVLPIKKIDQEMTSWCRLAVSEIAIEYIYPRADMHQGDLCEEVYGEVVNRGGDPGIVLENHNAGFIQSAYLLSEFRLTWELKNNNARHIVVLYAYQVADIDGTLVKYFTTWDPYYGDGTYTYEELLDHQYFYSWQTRWFLRPYYY